MPPRSLIVCTPAPCMASTIPGPQPRPRSFPPPPGPLAGGVAVEAAPEHEPLLADARVPAVRGLVAVEVLRLPVAVGRADADDDAVLEVRAPEAVVRVVGSAGEDERVVLGVLVAVDALPVTAREYGQRVRDHDRLLRRRCGAVRGGEIPRRQGEGAERGGRSGRGGPRGQV